MGGKAACDLVAAVQEEDFRILRGFLGDDGHGETITGHSLVPVLRLAEGFSDAVAEMHPLRGIRGYPGTGQQIKLSVLLLVDWMEIVALRAAVGDVEGRFHAFFLI